MDNISLSELLNHFEQKVNEKRDVLYEKIMQPDCNGLRRSSMLRQLHCLVEASDALSTAGQHIRKNHNRYLHESAEQPKSSRQALSSDSSDEPQEESSSLNEPYRSAFGVGTRMLARRKKAAPKEQVQRSASSGRVGMAKPIGRAPSPAPVLHSYDYPCCSARWIPPRPPTPAAVRIGRRLASWSASRPASPPSPPSRSASSPFKEFRLPNGWLKHDDGSQAACVYEADVNVSCTKF